MNWIEFYEHQYGVDNETGKIDDLGIIRYKIRKAYDDRMIFENGKIKKYIRVVPSDEYVYRVTRSRILAEGGRDGLYEFLERDTSFRKVITHKVFSYMIGQEEPVATL